MGPRMWLVIGEEIILCCPHCIILLYSQQPEHVCAHARTHSPLLQMLSKQNLVSAASCSVAAGVMAYRMFRKWKAKDHNAWLEDVLGDRSMVWVKDRNCKTLETFGEPSQLKMYDRILSILNSKDKIPYARKINSHYYNFWTDATNQRGLLRRTTREEYAKETTNWEIVLDVDELGQREKESWVYKGSTLCKIGDKPATRTLLKLSRGGADACVIREFDLTTKAFVPASEGGFVLQEAKSRVSWKDENTLLVGTDFGPGSLTSSGYPRLVKEWKRGTSLDTARMVFEAEETDISASGWVTHDNGNVYEWVERAMTFYTSKHWMVRGGKQVALDIPDDMQISTFRDQFLFQPRTDWTHSSGVTVPQGGLASIPVEDFFNLGSKATVTLLFVPDAACSLESWARTQNYLVIELLQDVKSVQHYWKFASSAASSSPGKRGWQDLGRVSKYGMNSVSQWSVDSEGSDELWMSLTGYLNPSQLFCVQPLQEQLGKPLKQLPAMFDAEGLQVQQHFSISKDGTKVPYFLVSRENLKLDGSNPTLLYGYGGFEINEVPYYSASSGVGWLEAGGVLALANIRGGGEYGPKWHQAALKENRNKAYEDFIGIAEDLIARGVTKPAKLACKGGSNGGLLVGNMLTMRPDLFGAVVCQVPLLDMKRYTHLLAGASWSGEYGDPDTDDWKFLQKFSPYHNVDPDAKYPPVFFSTSTRDDRVHPAHARKMVKLLSDTESRRNSRSGDTGASTKIFYYENIEGGHGGAADNKQRAFMQALTWEFLHQTLFGNPTPKL